MSTVTYYFNSYDTEEAWTITPEEMVDADENEDAKTGEAETQLCDGNTCDGTVLGIITKVELRPKYAYSCTLVADNGLILRPVFGGANDGDNHGYPCSAPYVWGSYVDITSDTNAPGTWSWADVQTLDCDVDGLWGVAKPVSCGRVEIRVTYDIPLDTGWKSPTATGGKYNVWTDPTDAYSSNNNWAYVLTYYGNHHFQSYENFDFGITVGVTIIGIEVKVEGHTGDAPDQLTELGTGVYNNGGSAWSSQKYEGWEHQDTDTTHTYGGMLDLWGESWVDSDFFDANFSMNIEGTSAYSGGNFNWEVDHVQVKIYYTPATHTKTLSDSVSLSATFDKTSVAERTFSETHSLTESKTIEEALRKTDNLNLIETEFVQSEYLRSFLETLDIKPKLKYIDIDYYPISPHVMTFTDAIKKESGFLRSFLESVGIIESKATDSSFQQNLTENLGIIDSKLSDIAKLPSDSISFLESLVKYLSFYRTDSMPLSEVFDISSTIEKTETETFSLSETKVFETLKNLSDSLTLADISPLKRAFTEHLGETLTLAESLTKLLTFEKTFTETEALVEIFSKESGRSLSDSVLFLETLKRELSIFPLEVLILSEAKEWEVGKKIVDSMGLTELLTKDLGFSMSDTISLSESISRIIEIKRTFSDTFALVESIAPVTTFTRVLVETLVLSEILSKEVGLIFTDSLSLVEIFQKISTSTKFLTDSLTFVEALSKKSGLTITDSLTLLESLQRIAGFSITLSDPLLLAETLSKEAGITLADSSLFIESTDFVTGTTTFISDFLTFAESFLKESTLSKGELLSLIESFSKVSVISRTFPEILSLVEELKKDKSLIKVDSLPLTENLLKSIDLSQVETLSFLSGDPVFNISKFFFQTEGLSEAKIITTAFIRGFSDSVSLAETLEKISGLSFSEALILAEVFLATFEIKQDLVETLKLIESHLKNVGIKKIVSFNLVESLVKESKVREVDILVLSDSLKTEKTARLILTDTFTLIETLIKNLGLTFQESLSLVEILSFVEKEGIPQKAVLVTRKKQTISLTKGGKTYLFFKQ